MSKTYTYTARSADDPAQVATFTFYDQNLSIELSTPITQAKSKAKDQSIAWREAASILKGLDKPRLDVADVDAGVEKDCLRLMAWACARDRRWLPITIVIEHVDNAEAARAFVKELNRRKMAAARRARMRTWLGARPYWFLAGSLTALVAMISLKTKHS